MSSLKIAALLGLASTVVAAHAHAACGHPDLIDTVPSDRAEGVPTNIVLSARYAQSAEYADEEISFEHTGVGPEPVMASFSASEGIVSLTTAPLVPNEAYTIHWPPLRGIASAAKGLGADVSFTTGPGEDTAPPTFAGLFSVDWDVTRTTDDCTDSPEDRYVLTLTPGDASDDGARDLLRLVVFQTRGPTIAGSPAPILVGPLPKPQAAVEVQRSIESGVGDVCFAALLRDSAGHISGGADHEVCATTVRPPFFYGCALAPESTETRSLDAMRGTLASILALVLGSRSLGSRRRRG